MEIQELLQSYLIKLNSLKDLVDIKPALEDEEDVLVNNYALLAKESVCLASLSKEFQEEKLRTESVTGDIQVGLANVAFFIVLICFVRRWETKMSKSEPPPPEIVTNFVAHPPTVAEASMG